MQILLLTMMSNKYKMLIQSKKQLIIFNLNIYVIKIFVLYLIPININITLNKKVLIHFQKQFLFLILANIIKNSKVVIQFQLFFLIPTIITRNLFFNQINFQINNDNRFLNIKTLKIKIANGVIQK